MPVGRQPPSTACCAARCCWPAQAAAAARLGAGPSAPGCLARREGGGLLLAGPLPLPAALPAGEAGRQLAELCPVPPPAAMPLPLLRSPLLLLVLAALPALCAALPVADPRPVATGQPRATRQLLNREWELSWPPKLVDVRRSLAVHDRFVPVIGASGRGGGGGGRGGKQRYKGSFLQKRQELFDVGCYPGVEYRIRAIEVEAKDKDGEEDEEEDKDEDKDEEEDEGRGFSSVAEALSRAADNPEQVYLSIRPAYPLIPQLERAWPVRVQLSQIPWALSRGAYNVVTVASSALLAASVLFFAFGASLAVTLSVVNTRSMQPTIEPRDVVLVEKVSPVLKRTLRLGVAAPKDIVFFRQPAAMGAYIAANKLPPVGSGDLIVKRVRSVVSSACLDVRGDNPSVSLDSRDWGCLPVGDVAGSPLLIVWPPSRVGLLR